MLKYYYRYVAKLLWKRAEKWQAEIDFLRSAEHYAAHSIMDLEEQIYWAKSRAVELEAKAAAK